MGYTCAIHTDYIDRTKKEEILQRIAKIVAESIKNAPPKTEVQTGAETTTQVLASTERSERK